MVFNIGSIGYGIAAFAYLGLAILLFASRKGKVLGSLFILAMLVSSIWAGAYALQIAYGGGDFSALVAIEIVRYAVWILFTLGLLNLLNKNVLEKYTSVNRVIPIVSFSTVILISAIVAYLGVYWNGDRNLLGFYQACALINLTITCLVLIEQLFRNTDPGKKWSIKYIFLGAGTLFVFDFFLFADTILSRNMDPNLLYARGYVNVLVVPMLAIAASRNRAWTGNIFISKQIVFYSATMVGAGIYLLTMAVAAYYIQIYGGEWGGIAQAVFLVITFIMLAALFFSDNMRAFLKVFLNKHFFANKYEYREEWLALTEKFSYSHDAPDLQRVIIRSIADILDSSGGMLWLYEQGIGFQCVANVNIDCPDEIVSHDDSLIRFLRDKMWVIDIIEWENNPDSYQGMPMPEWLKKRGKAWLIIPMLHGQELLGFLVLNKSGVRKKIDWEDRDLLKTASKQAASYLALLKANAALKMTDQFAVFNRLSSYVVHDLKNLVAQLSLVVKNSEKYRDNPDFVTDAFSTVRSATVKMERLLAELRKGRFDVHGESVIEIPGILLEIIKEHDGFLPEPQITANIEPVRIIANRDRFCAVIGHVIRNAQEATADDGSVVVTAASANNEVSISVTDNGCGMDLEFIRKKLFAPFETTKGNAGMGIGVYECREFIQSLGGRIEVKSIPGSGTTFTMVIPENNSEARNELMPGNLKGAKL